MPLKNRRRQKFDDSKSKLILIPSAATTTYNTTPSQSMSAHSDAPSISIDDNLLNNNGSSNAIRAANSINIDSQSADCNNCNMQQQSHHHNYSSSAAVIDRFHVHVHGIQPTQPRSIAMDPPSKCRIRQRQPRPTTTTRVFATAVATAVGMSQFLSAAKAAAFSTPPLFTPHHVRSSISSTAPSSSIARNHLIYSHPDESASSSCDDDYDYPPIRGRGPLHQTTCSHYFMMSMDELLERGTNTEASTIRQSNYNYYALQGDAPLRQGNSRRFNVGGRCVGSQSGRYGGLARSERSPTTSLSVSQSTNVLGFQLEDFESYNPQNNNNSQNNNEDDENELQFIVEDFDSYQDNNNNNNHNSLEKGSTGRRLPMVRTLNPRTASPTSKYIAASLLKNGSTTRLGRELTTNKEGGSGSGSGSGSTTSNTKHKSTNEDKDGSSNLPWLPTESQIKSLKVAELRAACAERGLIMTGLKADLQTRLLKWASMEDKKRVKDRMVGLKDLIELSKSKEAPMVRVDVDIASYDVTALTNKRKALAKEKMKRGRGKKKGSTTNNNRGVLGLVDESYFNTTDTDVELDHVEVEEEEEEEELTEDEDNSMVNEASINQLSKSFNAPSSNFSNREVREMYIEAKAADQVGNRRRSKAILTQLRYATPHDMRVVRRLSRMEQEDGNISMSRKMLMEGLEMEPNNAHLLQGLGQLERSAGNDYTAKKYFRRATKRDPMFPNPYHALGTLEHTHGNIRAALTVIKEGIKHCPYNHRLYHALGDVYLDANMLDLAEEAYLAGLQHAPHWGKSFFYTSLSFVSYAQEHTRDARTLLRQSLEVNGGMHAQGVIALAQLEESEGDIQEARKVYRDAVSRYEKKRRNRSPVRKPKSLEKEIENVFDTSSIVDKKGSQYSPSYSGDKWINVFKSWARMEEIHGTYETTHIVFSKAARLFPGNISLLIQWAELQAENGDAEKAKLLYDAACHRVGGRSAEPYRLYAEFEMKRKHLGEAQSILFRGAQAVSESSSGTADGTNGLARLFHTWGVCEYHLGSYSRSEQLFDDALRVTGSDEEDSAMRSLILYSMARLEYSRKEYLLAQHCIGLSLKENLLPGGNSLIWKLWSEIAAKMKNKQLLTRCKEQALLRWEEERGGAVSDLSRLLGERDAMSSADGRLPERTGSVMKDMFRKTPWYSKVCPPSGRMDKAWYTGARLWDL